MATMADLTQALTDLTTEVGHIGDETGVLVQNVADLTDALANVKTTPEVDAALAALQAQVKKVDDLVPDSTFVPPVTP